MYCAFYVVASSERTLCAQCLHLHGQHSGDESTRMSPPNVRYCLPEYFRPCDVQLCTIPTQSWTVLTLQISCIYCTYFVQQSVCEAVHVVGIQLRAKYISYFIDRNCRHHHQQQYCINNCLSVPSSWLLLFPSFPWSTYVFFSGDNIFIPEL
jgi:hypothetical protein